MRFRTTNSGRFVTNDLGVGIVLAIAAMSLPASFLYDRFIAYGNGNAFGIAIGLSLIAIYQSLPSMQIKAIKIFIALYVLVNIFVSFMPFLDDKHFTILAMPAIFGDYAVFVFGASYVANKF